MSNAISLTSDENFFDIEDIEKRLLNLPDDIKIECIEKIKDILDRTSNGLMP